MSWMIKGRHLVRAVGALSIVLPVLVTGSSATLGLGAVSGLAVFSPTALAFATVGWLIAERQPGNMIGALLLTFGFGVAAFILGDTYTRLPGPLPGSELVAVVTNGFDAPLFIVVALSLILFPNGRLPGPGWRWVTPLAAAASACAIVGIFLLPGSIPMFPEARNPLGVAGFPGLVLVGIGYVGLFVLLMAGAGALIMRWRIGNQVERAQIKWVGTAAVLLVCAEVVTFVTYRPGDIVTPGAVIQMSAVTLVPISMGIAILRYHLYDIDRIISRGLSYAIVVAALSGLFIGAVLLLQAALAGITQGESLAVAASTLLAFAVFQPLRRRVQEEVDRRFDRARYDAQQTVDGFAERLRNEVDLDNLRSALVETAGDTVRPSGAAVWLHATGGNR